MKIKKIEFMLMMVKKMNKVIKELSKGKLSNNKLWQN